MSAFDCADSGRGFVNPMDMPEGRRFAAARRSLSRQSSATLTALVRQSSSAREKLLQRTDSARAALRRRSSHALQALKKQLRRGSSESSSSTSSSGRDADAAEMARPLEERGRRKRIPQSRRSHHARTRRFTGQALTAFNDDDGFLDDEEAHGGYGGFADPLRRSLSSRSVGSRSVGSRSVGALEQGRSQPSFRVSEHAAVSRHAKSLGVRTKRATRTDEALGDDDDDEYLDAMRAYLAKRDARQSLYL